MVYLIQLSDAKNYTSVREVLFSGRLISSVGWNYSSGSWNRLQSFPGGINPVTV